MRDIRFRAKHIDTDEWIYGSSPVTLQNGKHAMLHLNDGEMLTVTIVKSDTVGEYVGVKDKNKVEVWEGDIVKIPCYEVSEVFWSNGGYKVNGEYSVVGFPSQAKRCEVVGNVHDNPDLLAPSTRLTGGADGN